MDDTAISRLLPHPGDDCFSLLPTNTAGPGPCPAAFGRGKPLPYGKAEESTVYHRAGQLMGTRRLFPWGRLHSPEESQGGSIGGVNVLWGPNRSPASAGPVGRGRFPLSGGNGRRPKGVGTSKGAKCSFPRQRETKHSGLCEDEARRPTRKQSRPAAPVKSEVRGRRCGGCGRQSRPHPITAGPRHVFRPFLRGQKWPFSSPP